MNMGSTVVVGTQWGDEGKGKIIDIIAGTADVVVRSQGGNNAGHTVVSGGETYKLHLVPSGILYKDTLCLVGAGVVIDPKDFTGEIEALSARGVSFSNLRIDPRAHVVMPWHIKLDKLSESFRGKDNLGTTNRGIGPAYMDKYERSGIRVSDLVNEAIFPDKVREKVVLKNKIIANVYGGEAYSEPEVEDIIKEYSAYGKKLLKYVGDVSVLVYDAHKAGKTIMFEGAQATLLDIDYGTYPFVTSSHPVSAGVCVGTGIGPNLIDEIIGVAKAYTTRVGTGPFPTELFDEVGDTIRTKGAEFGTTTGRPRRTGWFDAVIMRHSVRVNGLTKLAVNKLDTLQNIPELKICTAYEKPDGTILKHYPPALEDFAVCRPVYETLPGFTEDISGCKTFGELPESCQKYILRLEELSECRIWAIGIGPGREQVITR
ncbi:adenylosuccinate synthetase [Clostridia bacterium]|nr:adenylosuccinate synthetase [Clostridia bacterium]